MSDNKAPDGAGNQSDDQNQQQNTTPKTYSEEAFKDVVKQRDEVKQKLRVLEEERLTSEKKAQEEQLKARGEYEKLTELKNQEAKTAVQAAMAYIGDAYLSKLGTKHGIIDEEGLALFKAEFKFSNDFTIENASDIDAEFEKFKKAKPYLFKTEDKKVPRTDNLPFKKTTEKPSDGKQPLIPLSEILAQRATSK